MNKKTKVVVEKLKAEGERFGDRVEAEFDRVIARLVTMQTCLISCVATAVVVGVICLLV